ncbi:hypothetical protein [Caballeronia ptereochthonis]|uniref:Uncharacterized protein n=1 Tax=Caballeronia ptereochthonis TaxID=1777144 RepID=A0A158E599_9BURK|nr:hypothetical protein [Caballeronia ptereochthonis]SAL01984.1 hypothetical protein AWB83_06516 [Caballeronia ptereochthonis]
MSLAWATVVIAVLLTPGAAFFAGLYIPQAVSVETVTISPLGQLAGMVFVAFLAHGVGYLTINYVLADNVAWISQIDFAEFFPLLHADVDPAKDGNKVVIAIAAGLSAHVGHILGYFLAVNVISLVIGLLIGFAIEFQIGPFAWLAKHPWLYQIRGRRRLVVVSAMSKVDHEGQLLLYEGLLSNVYIKADGAISYMALTSVTSRVMAFPERPTPCDDQSRKTVSQLPGTITQGAIWRLKQAPSQSVPRGQKTDILLLPGSEISNFFLERRQLVRTVSKKAMDEAVEDAERELAERTRPTGGPSTDATTLKPPSQT